jgi:hypothetical protein
MWKAATITPTEQQDRPELPKDNERQADDESGHLAPEHSRSPATTEA